VYYIVCFLNREEITLHHGSYSALAGDTLSDTGEMQLLYLAWAKKQGLSQKCL
jgi:hypothetical protein